MTRKMRILAKEKKQNSRTFYLEFLIVAFRVLYFLNFTLNSNAVCEAYGTINADDLVLRDTRLDGHTFWSATVSDIGSCVRSCIKLKRCVSFNFQVLTKFCELNSDSLEYHLHSEQRVAGVVYSNISVWPPEVDPHCYGHSCAIDEVCVPGVVAKSLNLSGCSPDCLYSCFKMTKLYCPLPSIRVADSLTIGSVAVCPRGYVGDSALCQESQTWSEEINNTCDALYNNTCVNATSCEDIDGTYDNNKCVCAEGTTYSPDKLKCLPDCVGFRDSCYTFNETKVNWEEALQQCQNDGGHLLELEDLAEHNFIRTLNQSTSSSYWWTGGNDMDKDDVFHWDSTALSFDNTHMDWQPGFPSLTNSHLRCVVLYRSANFTFTDKKCTVTQPYICEKDKP